MPDNPQILRLYRHKTKKTKNWYMRGTVFGVSVDASTGTHIKAIAAKVAATKEEEIIERRGAAPGWTFLDAAESHVEFGGDGRFLGKLAEHFDKMPIEEIGQEETDAAARHLYPGRTAATIRRQVYVPVKAVLNHAAKRKRCEPPMIDSPKVRQKETRWAEPDYVMALLPHCKPKLRRLVIFLVYTGRRITEVVNLDWEDIHLQRCSAMLYRTKNDEAFSVNLPPPVIAMLSETPEHARKGSVFGYKSKSSVYGPLQNACKAAGLEYLTPHQLGRHTFATWLLNNGNDIKTVQMAGGWKSLAAASRYLHVTPSQAAKASNNLPDVTSEPVRNPSNVRSLKR